MTAGKAYGAVFLFDDDSTQTIKRVWQQIADAGISDILIEESDQPHLSLGICEKIDCHTAQRAFDSFVASIDPFEIVMPYIGIFPAVGVVYFGVTVTEHLAKLHGQFTDIFKAIATVPNIIYFPGSWVPHCTLAYDLKPEEVLKGVDIIQNNSPLPITCRVEKIALIEFPPWKECFSCRLRHCNAL
jgi:2'-5' RNA ligase